MVKNKPSKPAYGTGKYKSTSGPKPSSNRPTESNDDTDTKPEPKQRINGFDTIDPGTIPSAAPDSPDSGTPKPKRNPWYDRNKQSAKPATAPAKDGVVGLEGILLSIHYMLAAMFDAEELILTEQQARRLSGAMTKVGDYYEKEMNPAVLIWVNLATVAGSLYGPKIWTWRQRLKAERAAQTRPDNVKPMPGPQAAPRPTAAPPGGTVAQNPADVFGDFNSAALPELG